MDEIKIFITFDLDPDFNNSKSLNNIDRWKGLKKGSLIIIKELKKIFNFYIPISWFVRVDDEIKNEFGSYLGIIKKNEKIFERLHKFCGKFYLHPHLYYFNIKDKIWKQELDNKKNLNQIKNILKSVKNTKYFKKKIIRIGGHYFSRQILDLLIKKKFKIDSTSLPGRKGFIAKPFNWKNGKRNLHYLKLKNKNGMILEAPPTMFEIKADYDKKPLMRYLDLTFKNLLMKKYIKNIKFDSRYILTLSHPSQIILTGKHGLLGYGIKNYLKNLKLLVQRIKEMGLKYKFYHIEDLLKYEHLAKLRVYEK